MITASRKLSTTKKQREDQICCKEDITGTMATITSTAVLRSSPCEDSSAGRKINTIEQPQD